MDEAAGRGGLTRRELSQALASFVRSILAGNSRFYRFMDGDREAPTADEQEGLRVFRTMGRCSFCHAGPTFSDEEFHNTGVAWSASDTLGGTGRFLENGRWLVTGRDADRGAFRTPTLPEVARTAPYMHDGSLATLEDVVDFYDRGGRPNLYLDIDIRPGGVIVPRRSTQIPAESSSASPNSPRRAIATWCEGWWRNSTRLLIPPSKRASRWDRKH